MGQAFERQESAQELARLRTAIMASGDVFYDWDLATDSLSWLGRAEALFALPEDDLPKSGDGFNSRINPEDHATRSAALSNHFAEGTGYDCEFRVRTADGGFQWVHDRGAAELSAQGTPQRMVGSLRLITARKQHEARLEYLAHFDDLTGHFNKLRLREALEHTLSYAQRFSSPAAFLMVGIDQLGLINTAYGFEVGDAVLVEVARRLDRCLRASDVVGRPSGDRFGVILSGATMEEARITAERILAALRSEQIAAGDQQPTVSASIGIVALPSQAKTSFDVMAKAESAMLHAKSIGRDCVHVFELTEDQRRGFQTSLDIGERVKQALRDDRMLLAFQPVVEARSHETAYYECLVRIDRGDGTFLPAAQFIPIVEQLGLMRTIDRHVLGLALKVLERQPEVTLAINISGLTATDRSWLRCLVNHLKGRRELAQRLMVEITETAALQDIEESARFVAAVRELGCKVALDDFGAGYTTFRHMKALTVDVVKIDGSFIRDITESPENLSFVRNLLSLARTIGVSTVAECVETLAEAQVLAREGVDLLQGYCFGRPEVWIDGQPIPGRDSTLELAGSGATAAPLRLASRSAG